MPYRRWPVGSPYPMQELEIPLIESRLNQQAEEPRHVSLRMECLGRYGAGATLFLRRWRDEVVLEVREEEPRVLPERPSGLRSLFAGAEKKMEPMAAAETTGTLGLMDLLRLLKVTEDDVRRAHGKKPKRKKLHQGRRME